MPTIHEFTPGTSSADIWECVKPLIVVFGCVAFAIVYLLIVEQMKRGNRNRI